VPEWASWPPKCQGRRCPKTGKFIKRARKGGIRKLVVRVDGTPSIKESQEE